jgi:hypothetical protein
MTFMSDVVDAVRSSDGARGNAALAGIDRSGAGAARHSQAIA